ncbi:FAD-dependent oxidoreductase [Rhodopirellula halodulae]|uniref:FAD-dependent oxidoreductase n=1 Tax=Rhodopirellula halodulae TaxID=2894198 RepID=UPI001E5D4EB1|nr:FAD-dependent oxidoreductase [Rhodopirellula sp. JC737]MCC9656009.1 FAD-dependent oxidoreductase [Rhodopirellula sp. JC737]
MHTPLHLPTRLRHGWHRFGCWQIGLACLLLANASHFAFADDTKHDVVVYGGTAAAVTAAIQSADMGQSVVMVSPDVHLGGLTSGGLGWTDTGNKNVIGGLAKNFYHRVYKHYRDDASWNFQTRASYGNRAQGHRASDDDDATMWVFEPHVAEMILEEMLAERDITVIRDAWLNRENGVTTSDGRIQSIRTLDGQTFAGRMFIDATYEGDLIAAAGVSTTFGREGIADYNEPHAGVQTGVLHHSHHFDVLPRRVDPYIVPGDPSSGVLPLVSPDPPGEFGSADHRVQAYCFRTCMTNHEANRIPWKKPEGYDPATYEIMARTFEAGWRNVFNKFDPLPNFKTDTNNHGPVSFDNIGANYDYPEASYERRKEIIEQHERYQRGLLYFIATDPRVPKEVQDEINRWGLAADEFTDNDHWPHQIYVREARRMVGQFVMTENHLRKDLPTPESVGMGSYSIDSHNTQRYITPEGYVQNEGDLGVSTRGPYMIAMGSLLPKKDQCENLLSPVCVSATHAAFGSIRMEPVFMILGQSAATIAALANESDVAVQEVPYETVRKRLLDDKQILEAPAGSTTTQHANARNLKSIAGITVDDAQAKRSSGWSQSHATGDFYGWGYHHDGNARDVVKTATFQTNLPKSGAYEVRVSYPASDNRSKQTRIDIEHSEGTTTHRIDQTKPVGDKKANSLLLLGTYRFDKNQPAKVVISNEDANGYVVIDVVNWQPVSEQ